MADVGVAPCMQLLQHAQCTPRVAVRFQLLGVQLQHYDAGRLRSLQHFLQSKLSWLEGVVAESAVPRASAATAISQVLLVAHHSAVASQRWQAEPTSRPPAVAGKRDAVCHC